MSKEQTPLTAEEWLDEEYPYILDGFEYLEIDKQVLEVMEQYAQAKVLEALEREVKQAYKEGWEDYIIEEMNMKSPITRGNKVQTAEQYYETEVKPKYE